MARKSLIASMPKTVKVGCFVYDVLVLHADAGDIAGVMGAQHARVLKIYVREEQPPLQLANTFLHEVLHAIHHQYGLDDGDDEESFTNLTANGLCAFWMDNPAAVKWWSRIVQARA